MLTHRLRGARTRRFGAVTTKVPRQLAFPDRRALLPHHAYVNFDSRSDGALHVARHHDGVHK